MAAWSLTESISVLDKRRKTCIVLATMPSLCYRHDAHERAVAVLGAAGCMAAYEGVPRDMHPVSIPG